MVIVVPVRGSSSVDADDERDSRVALSPGSDPLVNRSLT
jgi:hypothetical protein